MELIEFSKRPFIGSYALTRNLLHSSWESLISMLPKGKGLCLDIGCGNGLHREDIIARGYKWIGCDISKQRLENYVIGDGLGLPFKSNSIDVVFSNCVLEHMKDPFVALNELQRVLKRQGKIYLQVAFMEPFHGSYFHITHWGLEELASRSKLRIIQIEPGATTFVPIWGQLFDIVGVSLCKVVVTPITFIIQRVLRILGYIGIRVFYGKRSWQFKKYQGYFDRLPLKLAGHIKCIMQKPYTEGPDL